MALSCPARPHAIEAALQTGRVQAARLVEPEMPRYVALALAPHGDARVAGNCGGAAAALMAERTIAVRASATADQGCPTDTDARCDTMFVMTDSTSANVRRSVDQPLPARDDCGPLPRGIHHWA